MADVFQGSLAFLNSLKGKRVRIEMMNGEVPYAGATMVGATHSGVRLTIEGELLMPYDDALLVRLSDGKEKLIFARAIRAIQENA